MRNETHFSDDSARPANGAGRPARRAPPVKVDISPNDGGTNSTVLDTGVVSRSIKSGHLASIDVLKTSLWVSDDHIRKTSYTDVGSVTGASQAYGDGARIKIVRPQCARSGARLRISRGGRKKNDCDSPASATNGLRCCENVPTYRARRGAGPLSSQRPCAAAVKRSARWREAIGATGLYAVRTIHGVVVSSGGGAPAARRHSNRLSGLKPKPLNAGLLPGNSQRKVFGLILWKHVRRRRRRGAAGARAGARPARRRPLKGEDTNFLSSLKEGSFREVEKSYNRKGNLRFKSSNEAGNFLMEGRKAARELGKNLLEVIASSANRAAAGDTFELLSRARYRLRPGLITWFPSTLVVAAFCHRRPTLHPPTLTYFQSGI